MHLNQFGVLITGFFQELILKHYVDLKAILSYKRLKKCSPDCRQYGTETKEMNEIYCRIVTKKEKYVMWPLATSPKVP